MLVEANPLEELEAAKRRLAERHALVAEVLPAIQQALESADVTLVFELHAAVEGDGRLDEFLEEQVDTIGHRRLQWKRTEALEAFELNAENFPDSSRAWQSLGDALRVDGDGGRALDCYERALEIDPDAAEASRKAEELAGG